MTERYEVEMTVSLGVRRGVMVFKEQDGIVKGTFEILGHETAFEGQLNGQYLTISGKLETSIREICYTGRGMLENDCIQMQLQSEKDIYEITGVRSPSDR